MAIKVTGEFEKNNMFSKSPNINVTPITQGEKLIQLNCVMVLPTTEVAPTSTPNPLYPIGMSNPQIGQTIIIPVNAQDLIYPTEKINPHADFCVAIDNYAIAHFVKTQPVKTKFERIA